jgi:hypothetical protein
MGAVQALPERIEGARADVAEDDTDCTERESREPAARGLTLTVGDERT